MANHRHIVVPFDRDPIGWIHPLYRRRASLPHQDSWDLGHTVNSLNQLLSLAHHHQPRVVQSLASQREAAQREKFTITMNLETFAPEEIQVKMVDNFLVVECKHEEKEDEHGFVFRHFVRRYQIPDDVKPENITCNLSSDGVLHVHAFRAVEEKKGEERSLPINFTGKPSEVKAPGQPEKK